MNYYEEIKNEFINNEINKKVKNYLINRKDLETRYNVGKLLSEAGKKYGESIIIEYSKKLTLELGKGYNVTNLKRYRQFYLLIQKGAPLSHQLSWSYSSELIPLKNTMLGHLEESNNTIRLLVMRNGRQCRPN